MGFIRKALFIATGGISGLVFKDDSKSERTEKAAQVQARARKQTKGKRSTTRTARTSAAKSRSGTTAELERLADLHGRGALTDQEFAAAKAKILGTSQTPNGSDTGPASGSDAGPPRFQAVEANVAAARDLPDLAARDRGAVTVPGNGD
jgi:multidrug resistance efflux pump